MYRVDVTTKTNPSWTDTGDTTNLSANITNLNPAIIADINIGDYVTVSAGMPSVTNRYQVISKGPTSLTLNDAAVSTIIGVTVTAVIDMYTNGVANVTPRTTLDGTHLNAIQEEIMTILNAGSVAPDKPNSQQLLAALTALYVNRTGDTMTGDLINTKSILAKENLRAALKSGSDYRFGVDTDQGVINMDMKPSVVSSITTVPVRRMVYAIKGKLVPASSEIIINEGAVAPAADALVQVHSTMRINGNTNPFHIFGSTERTASYKIKYFEATTPANDQYANGGNASTVSAAENWWLSYNSSGLLTIRNNSSSTDKTIDYCIIEILGAML